MDVAQLIVSSVAIVIVPILSGLILRLYAERQKNWESQKALMEERLKLKDERLQDKDRHIRQMAELHQVSEKILQRRLEDLQTTAGVDPEAPLSATAPAISEELQQSMLEVLDQLRDIRSGVEQLAPAAAPTTLTAEDSILRGYGYYQAGQYDDALAEFNRALDLRPDDARTLYNRGVTLGELERHDDALADYSHALDLRPDHADTLVNRGATLDDLERYDDALADYDRALDLRPDDADTLNNRGITLRHLERYDDAVADYSRALELRPGHAATLYNRACLYSVWKKADQALADLSRAIDGDAENRALARGDSDFDNIRSDPRFQELVGEDDPPPAEDADDEDS